MVLIQSIAEVIISKYLEGKQCFGTRLNSLVRFGWYSFHSFSFCVKNVKIADNTKLGTLLVFVISCIKIFANFILFFFVL